MNRRPFRIAHRCLLITSAWASLALADTPGAPKGRPVVDPKATAALIKLGQEAFESGSFTEARDAFSDAAQSDPANLLAARDLAITYLRLEKPAKAAKPLELASNAKVLDRSLVLAIASERVAAKSPMQAVKHILVYTDAHPTPPDEAMVDALGIALARADAAGIKSVLYTEAVKAYKKLNAKLESTRPGEKRWGSEWMPGAEVDKRQQALTTALLGIQTNAAAVHKLEAQIAVTQRQKDAVLYTEGDNNQTQKKDAYQRQIDQMNGELSKVQKELDAAMKSRDEVLPHWPEEIPVDQLTLATSLNPTLVAETPATTPPITPPVTPAIPTTPLPSPESVTTPLTPDATPAVTQLKPNTPSLHGTRFAAAFAVAPDLIITMSAAVADSNDIQVQTSSGHSLKGEIVRNDAASGLTLLRVKGATFTAIPLALSAKTGIIKCEAFPDVNLFNPSSQELKGSINLNGEHPTANLDRYPRLPGGPVLQDGKLVAVEVGDRDSDREAVPVVAIEAIKSLVSSDATGITPPTDFRNAVFQVAASR